MPSVTTKPNLGLTLYSHCWYCVVTILFCFVFYLFLGRPERQFPDGLMFYRRCFLLFFRHEFSEVPRPIALKLCHMVRIWPNFIIPLQKFGGRSPKNLGAKNMQNFGQFWTTSDFDREYLRNG